MTAPNELSPAIFLDRDGTLMREVEYCGDPKKVAVFAGVPQALVRLRDAGYKLVVISNQAGIGRGYFTEQDYRAVEAELERQILPGRLDATYFCPDHPDHATDCRKPAPGMVLAAERDLGLDLARSFLIGDKAIDVECGRNAGVRTLLVKTGYGADQQKDTIADWIAEDFPAATNIILDLNQNASRKHSE